MKKQIKHLKISNEKYCKIKISKIIIELINKTKKINNNDTFWEIIKKFIDWPFKNLLKYNF